MSVVIVAVATSVLRIFLNRDVVGGATPYTNAQQDIQTKINSYTHTDKFIHTRVHTDAYMYTQKKCTYMDIVLLVV